ncbi:hypothetical protein JCM17960_17020 [Magnetospira thiophila]
MFKYKITRKILFIVSTLLTISLITLFISSGTPVHGNIFPIDDYVIFILVYTISLFLRFISIYILSVNTLTFFDYIYYLSIHSFLYTILSGEYIPLNIAFLIVYDRLIEIPYLNIIFVIFIISYPLYIFYLFYDLYNFSKKYAQRHSIILFIILTTISISSSYIIFVISIYRFII